MVSETGVPMDEGSDVLTKKAPSHSMCRLEAASKEAVRLASLRSYLQCDKIFASEMLSILVQDVVDFASAALAEKTAKRDGAGIRALASAETEYVIPVQRGQKQDRMQVFREPYERGCHAENDSVVHELPSAPPPRHAQGLVRLQTLKQIPHWSKQSWNLDHQTFTLEMVMSQTKELLQHIAAEGVKAEEAVMAKMGNLPPMSAAYISLRERAAKRKQGSSAPNVAIDIVVVNNIKKNDKHKILQLQ